MTETLSCTEVVYFNQLWTMIVFGSKFLYEFWGDTTIDNDVWKGITIGQGAIMGTNRHQKRTSLHNCGWQSRLNDTKMF